ncbi:CRISPR-associated protein [Escherichia coli]|uniref:CRISPR-associated protein n=1 Tax=Escherichia coli TaxID=562 RepID=A0A376L451_ECOLX|nr:CRISPR-associated protein [Escherichia coli]
MTFVPLSPIPLKDRTSMIFLQYGQIDVLDGAFVLIDKTGIRTHIPVGSVACIMLEPGTRVFPRGGASGRHGGDATGLGR